MPLTGPAAASGPRIDAMPLSGPRPRWLTFDCYGTLIQWDEGLLAAIGDILQRHGAATVAPSGLVRRYDRYEHDLEQAAPFRPFREVAGEALRLALAELGLDCDASDVARLTASISRMPPFPEVVGALAELKAAGFRLRVISNTDDDLIAGNVAQLGEHIDRVVTAQQAGAYKPSPRIFEHAYRSLGVTLQEVVHICASPQPDHTAARDVDFRCLWIDRGTGRTLLRDYVPDAIFPTLDRVPEHFREIGWA